MSHKKDLTLVDDLINEYEKMNTDGTMPEPLLSTRSIVQSAKDKLLKEAAKEESDRISNFDSNSQLSKDKNEFLNQEIDAKTLQQINSEIANINLQSLKRDLESKHGPADEEEDVGKIEYIHGKCQVVLDDKYLEPFQNDLSLRHNEFNK
jgi:hypothetical protein